MLVDKFGRKINYVRIAVTDRCNLRCSYCMPEHQHFLERESLLTYEEIAFLTAVLARQGVDKVRITGGEPFVRKDISHLLKELSKIDNIDKLTITTNGVLTSSYINELKAANINQVNLSLDTLNKDKFFNLTKRDELSAVMNTFYSLIGNNFHVKLNMVVMEGFNTCEIHDFIELTRKLPVSVRFIEEMPFNGQGNSCSGITWNADRIISHIRERYHIRKLPDPANAIALHYKITNFAGNIAVIPAYSRSLCGSCNRLRITATGDLKLCLYSDAALNLRDLLRSGIGEEELVEIIQNAVLNKPINGFEAEKQKKSSIHESMSMIGG